jgi:hypothetical protein
MGPTSSSDEPTQGADEMTTSQTYQSDDDQLTQAHDQAISEDNATEPEASLAAPDPDMAENPVTDLATAEPDLTEPDGGPVGPEADLAEPDAEHTGPEDLKSHPAGPAALAESDPAASMVSGYPGFIADGDDGAAEPGMADGSPSLVSGAFTVPESVADSHRAGDTAPTAGPWNEVQAMFVDDPRASIERAAGLIDDRVEELIRSVRERQRSMQSAWQADEAGTEELRVALQHYRSFWSSLEDLPA